MLWVFAALACNSSDGDAPENERPVESGDDTATDGSGDDTATDVEGADEDGDGYAAKVDCDDAKPDVHPGAEETCGNGRDDNCDGTADGCEWSGEQVLEGTVLSTTDDDFAMGATVAVCDANGDGIADVVTGAPGYASGTIGAVYAFDGPITYDRDAKDADYALMGSEPDLRVFVDCRRDIDGDTIADLVVAEPGGTYDVGAVYVVPGGGGGRTSIADEASSSWIGPLMGEYFGYQAIAFDVDGDETDELAVALFATGTADNPPVVTYVFGDTSVGTHDVEDATAYVYGGDGRDAPIIGNAGDLDGDGLEELAVTGKDARVPAVLLFRAPLVGAIPTSAADVRIVGAQPRHVRWSGIGHADLDDDGRNDLFFADNNHGGVQGAAYVFFGSIDDDTSPPDADMRILDDGSNLGIGSDVACPGDVNADGRPDLLIGTAYGGTVFLLYGEGPGVYDLGKDAQASWQWTNGGIYSEMTVAAGDVTGDGITEFLIGSPHDGEDYEGSITIVPSWQL